MSGVIYIDFRRGNRNHRNSIDFVPLIKSHGIEAEETKLDAADFAFTGQGPDEETIAIGIERKSLHDMLACLRDNRLSSEQVPNMIRDYFVWYLVLEGIYRTNPNGMIEEYYRGNWVLSTFGSKRGYYASELENHLNTLRLFRHLIVITSGLPIETTYRVINLHSYFNSKPWSQHSSHDALYTAPVQGLVNMSDAEKWMKRSVGALPNCGPEITKSIYSTYKSMDSLLAASVKDLCTLPGIAKKRAELYYNILRGRS